MRDYRYVDALIHNNSDVAAYPVTVETENTAVRFMLSANFFMLNGNESKVVRIVWDRSEHADFSVKGRNFEKTAI